MERNGSWRGGLHISTRGYAYLRDPGHPRAGKNGYVKRADVVMEKKLGRPLRRDEIVHHVNRNKLDDSPENLEAMTASAHALLHHPRKPRPERPPRRIIAWPPVTELRQMVETSSLRAAATKLGVSHVAVWRRLQ